MFLPNQYDVDGLEFCFPFLRYFGAGISILEIEYNHIPYRQKDHLDRYINQYCADTLTELIIRDGSGLSIENFPKPFERLEKIHISSFDLRNSFQHFANWIPNLKYLQMESTIFDKPTIAVSLPHLEHLSMCIGERNEFGIHDSNIENTVNLLHANPQLQKLELIFWKSKQNELLNLISRNAKLTYVLMDGGIANMNTKDLMQFRSEHPKLKLDLQNYNFGW